MKSFTMAVDVEEQLNIVPATISRQLDSPRLSIGILSTTVKNHEPS